MPKFNAESDDDDDVTTFVKYIKKKVACQDKNIFLYSVSY